MKKREMGLGMKKAVVSAMMAVLLMQSLGEAAGGVTAAEAAPAAVVKTERSLYKGTETAGPATPRATSKAEKEEVPGRLIQRRYEAYYRLNNGKKAKKNGVEYLQFRKLLEYSDIIKHAYAIGLEPNFRTARAKKCHSINK